MVGLFGPGGPEAPVTSCGGREPAGVHPAAPRDPLLVSRSRFPWRCVLPHWPLDRQQSQQSQHTTAAECGADTRDRGHIRDRSLC
jgi:hypothetical protein